VIDLEGVNFIESQGAAKVTEIHLLTEADGIRLRLAHVKPQVLAVLQADGIIDRIGADHIHGNVHRAVEAQWIGERHRRSGDRLGLADVEER
jgi:MFS superfamily sulfate permease-like transporter